jgi:hypothetical protein
MAAASLEHLFQVLGRQETIRRVSKATDKIRTFIKHEKEHELSEKAQLIKEYCISLGRPGIIQAKIFGILLDEDLSIKNNDAMFPYVKWAAVVPKNNDGHKYKPGEMCFVFISNSGKPDTDSVKAIQVNGQIGGDIALYMRSIDIPETEEVIAKINDIFDALVAKGLSDEGFGEEVMKGK